MAIRPIVGVLALQGDVAEHLAALERAGARAVVAVKSPRDLERVDALVVPGGESTTVMKLLGASVWPSRSSTRVRAGMPFWGTCMGLIVAAHDVAGLDQPTLDLIDVTVRRNAFGRQNESAEVELAIPVLGDRSRSRRFSFARRGSSERASGSRCWRDATATA